MGEEAAFLEARQMELPAAGKTMLISPVTEPVEDKGLCQEAGKTKEEEISTVICAGQCEEVEEEERKQ